MSMGPNSTFPAYVRAIVERGPAHGTRTAEEGLAFLRATFNATGEAYGRRIARRDRKRAAKAARRADRKVAAELARIAQRGGA